MPSDYNKGDQSPSAAIALTTTSFRPSSQTHAHTSAKPRKIAPPRGATTLVPTRAPITKPLLRCIQDNDTLRHIIAGTIARTISQLVIHPLDTIKTRLQVPPHGRTAPLRAWLRGVHATAASVRLPAMRVSIPNWAAKVGTVGCVCVHVRLPFLWCTRL